MFWAHVHELSDGERLVQRVEEGETRRQRQQSNEEILRRKVNSYAAPLQEMQIGSSHKVRTYSEEEDRFLLVRLAEYGLAAEDAYERIRIDILRHPEFRFDWFIKSRTAPELARRCQTLLLMLQKEDEDEKRAKRRASEDAKGSSKKARR